MLFSYEFLLCSLPALSYSSLSLDDAPAADFITLPWFPCPFQGRGSWRSWATRMLLLHRYPSTPTAAPPAPAPWTPPLPGPLLRAFLLFGEGSEKPDHSQISFSNVFSSYNREIRKEQNWDTQPVWALQETMWVYFYLSVCLSKAIFFSGHPQLQMLRDNSCLPTLNAFLSPAKEKYKVITRQ